jgi:hypothetical protein
MGLAERRALAEFQNTQLPGLQARIDGAAGFPVALEVCWEQLAPEGEAHLYAESWVAVFFEPLIAALESITRDQLGREALAARLKSVVVQNSKGHYYADGWAGFEAGVLTLDHEPLTNAGDGPARTKALIAVLESRL